MNYKAMSKIISFVLCLTMILSAGAYAFGISDDITPVLIQPAQKVTVTEQLDYRDVITADYPDPTPENSGLEWDWASRTLTMDGATIKSDSNKPLLLPSGSTIVLNGINIIRSYNTGMENDSSAIYCDGDLTITGSSGSLLDLYAGPAGKYSLTLSVQGSLTVSGDISIDAQHDSAEQSIGICVTYTLKMLGTKGPEVKSILRTTTEPAIHDVYGIYAGSIDIESGSLYTDEDSLPEYNLPFSSYGIYTQKIAGLLGNINMTGGTIWGNAGDARESSYGIYVMNNLTTSGKSTVIANAGDGDYYSYGLWVTGNADIRGERVSAHAGSAKNNTGYSYGIILNRSSDDPVPNYSENYIDARVDADAGEAGLQSFGLKAHGNLTIMLNNDVEFSGFNNGLSVIKNLIISEGNGEYNGRFSANVIKNPTVAEPVRAGSNLVIGSSEKPAVIYGAKDFKVFGGTVGHSVILPETYYEQESDFPQNIIWSGISLTIHNSEIKFMTGDSLYKTSNTYAYVEKPDDPQADGKYFAGWYADPECRSLFDFSEPVNGDIFLFAKMVDEAADISGTVMNDASPAAAVSGAAITLEVNGVALKSAVSGDDGSFSFGNVPLGVYNMVTRYDGRVVTTLVEVDDKEAKTLNVVVPVADVSSIVEIAPGLPLISVGGLDKLAMNYAEDGKKVEVKLEVTDFGSEDIARMKELVELCPKANIEFMNMTVAVYVEGSPRTEVHSLSEPIELSFNTGKEKNTSVQLYHDEDSGWNRQTMSSRIILEEKYCKSMVSGFSLFALVTEDIPVSSKYSVTSECGEHGSIELSEAKAAYGKTVEITVTPDRGYTLETLTVTDAKGKEIDITETDGKYSFRMPASAVKVSATFMEDNTMLNYFIDVTIDDYFYDAVLWAAVNGVTSGTDATHFSPYRPTTRGQVVTFLWNAAGQPVVNYAMPFTDVPDDAYYVEAVRWAASEGITSGVSATKFAPDQVVTRSQLITLIANMAGVKADDEGYTCEFTDVAETDYYSNAVAWAAENDITGGTGDGKFSPDNDCKRCEAVMFLYKYFTK